MMEDYNNETGNRLAIFLLFQASVLKRGRRGKEKPEAFQENSFSQMSRRSAGGLKISLPMIV